MESLMSVREIELEWIPLSDGTRLAARIWVPEDSAWNPVPAILEYVPYRRRDSYRERDNFTQPYFAARGYACLRVDVRGTGDSDGIIRDEYLKQEQDDGVEVIAWIARQPWCSGQVGMFGCSWGGFNSLQLAARRPPALKAIITSCSTDDRYADDMHYMGGCVLTDTMHWGTNFFARMARGPDSLMVGEDRWREMWRERLEAWEPPFITWLSHQARDDYWKHGSVCENYESIQCAVFAIGGWADGYSNAIFRMLANLKCPRIGVAGPWGHGFPHKTGPGPTIGFLQEAMRWWDQWLKDVDTGIMQEPMLRSWMQESVPPAGQYRTRPGYWAGDPSWPSPNVGKLTYGLGQNTLTRGEEKANSNSVLEICSPQTVGQHGGDWCGFGRLHYPDLPIDQREEDGGSLVFDTEPLSEDLSILGAPEVELEIASDRPVALVAVRLNEIRHDGSVLRVTYGVLNLTHRNGHEKPEPLVPGERYKVRVALNEIGHVFAAGHRIRLAISSTYWPIVWPSPEPVRLTVYTRGSRLHLPARKRQPSDEGIRFELPEIGRTTATTILKYPRYHRMVTRDIASNEIVHSLLHNEGRKILDEIATEIGIEIETICRIRPDDPTSARIDLRQVFSHRRGEGWDMVAQANCALSCSVEEFLAEATLKVLDGGRPFFLRSWLKRIPRDNV